MSTPRDDRGPASKWLVRPKQVPTARLRLFCFPYAGVGASAYRTWVPAFGPEVEVNIVQPPGRESRWGEPALASLRELVSGAADALGPFLTPPFAVFGHSLGALVAFELARELRRRGRPGPVWLFASAHRAPQLPNPHPLLHGLADGELVSEICRQYAGIPQAVLDDPELLALMLPGLRADFTSFETYRYELDEPLACPISAFGGTTDRRVTEAELDAWQAQTRAGFRLRMMDGDHFYLQPHRDAVIAAVSADLAMAGVTPIAAPLG